MLLHGVSAEVVLLDIGEATLADDELGRRLDQLEARVGWVVVGDTPPSVDGDATILPKWGSFDDIYAAVQAASRSTRSTLAP